MSGSELPEALAKLQAKEEELIMNSTDDREFIREYYSKCIVTPADLQRQYTDHEERELCLRTKVRVKMTNLNCLWDAKKRLMKKNRLVNRSERFINAMLVKSVAKKMVEPYTKEDVCRFNLITRSWLKKENNVRLDRWKRNREVTTPELTLSFARLAAPQVHMELSIDMPVPESGELLLWGVEDENETVAMAPEIQLDNTRNSLGDPDWRQVAAQINSESLSVEVSSQSQSHMDLSIEMPDPESEELLLWGVEDENETVAMAPETQLDNTRNSLGDPDWMQVAAQINSENLSVEVSSQSQSQSHPVESNSEDYNVFGTQVAASSTQENDCQ